MSSYVKLTLLKVISKRVGFIEIVGIDNAFALYIFCQDDPLHENNHSFI